MATISYSEVLARNIRAARGRAGLTQRDLAARMQHLGFKAWRFQVVGNVEQNQRRVAGEEILGLALALETSIPALTTATDMDDEIRLPSGQPIGAVSVERLAGRGVNDRAVQWRGLNVASYTEMRRLPGVDPFDPDIIRRPHFTEVPSDGE